MKKNYFLFPVCFLAFFFVCSSGCSKKSGSLLDRYPLTESLPDFENLKKSDLEMFLVVEDQVPEELLKDLPSDCMVYRHFKNLIDGNENFVLEKTPLMNGEDIESVTYSKNVSNTQIVQINFNEEGTEKLSRLTYEYSGEDILVKIGGNLLLNATVKSRIMNGQIVFYCSDIVALKMLTQLYGNPAFSGVNIPEGFVLVNNFDSEKEYENPDKMNPTDVARSFFYYYLKGDERYKAFNSYEKNYEEDFDSYRKYYSSVRNVKIALYPTEKIKISKQRTLNMVDSYGTSSMRYKKIPVLIKNGEFEYSSQVIMYLEKDNKGYRVVSIPK